MVVEDPKDRAVSLAQQGLSEKKAHLVKSAGKARKARMVHLELQVLPDQQDFKEFRDHLELKEKSVISGKKDPTALQVHQENQEPEDRKELKDY